jgi:ABC-type branched-subunit amino acid transport system substrate-binding protein
MMGRIFNTISAILIVWLCVLSPVSPITAQGQVEGLQQEEADPYQRARQFYMERRFSRAAEILEAALSIGGLGEYRASGWLLLSASRLGSDAPEPALQALDGLDREYPEGPYLLEREWLRARSHSRAGRFYEAASIYAEIVESETQGRISEAARDELALLVAERLDSNELRNLGYEWAGSDLKGWLGLIAVRELADRGDLARARKLMENLEAEAPEGGYSRDTARDMASLSESLKSAGPAGFVLGVLAPLTGPDREVGRDIIDAVRLALATAQVDAKLAVRNTRGSLEGTLKGTISLIRDEGAQLILGPYVEELALTAAGVAEGMEVPIILPYTQSAVTPTIGNNVYQLQATPRLQAEALADAAIDSLGMITFAVLNPLTGSGPDFAEAFMTRVEEKGGNVIAHKQFFPEASDYQDQLDAIRREGLMLSLRDTSETMITDLLAVEEANLDTLGEPVAVGSIDAIIVPATDQTSATQIALQIVFVNIATTIMGGSAWNSFDVINSGGTYVNGVIFTDAYSIGHTSTPQIDFANHYYSAYSRMPDRAATFAFDAARLALAAWQMVPSGMTGTDRKQAVRRWLSGVSAFEGASGPINFHRTGRINDNVFLMRIQQGTIVPLTITPVEAPIPPDLH